MPWAWPLRRPFWWAFGAKIELTYASAYDVLTEERRQAPQPQSPYAQNPMNFSS